MRLSYIKTDLEKCAQIIGAKVDYTDDVGIGFLKTSYGVQMICSELSRNMQAGIIDLLEQFAESRGAYLQPFRHFKKYRCVIFDDATNDAVLRTENAYETKLEAVLEVVVRFDWGKG